MSKSRNNNNIRRSVLLVAFLLGSSFLTSSQAVILPSLSGNNDAGLSAIKRCPNSVIYLDANGTLTCAPTAQFITSNVAPGKPLATAVGSGTRLTVTIIPPADDGGSPITGYTLAYSTSSGGEGTAAPITLATGTPATGGTYVITGLTAGNYYGKVYTTNAIGTGAVGSDEFSANIPVIIATSYTTTLSSASEIVGTSTNVTASPASGTSWPNGTTLMPSSTITGTFSPTSATPTGNTPVVFAFTPSAPANGTITVAASNSLTNTTGPVSDSATPVPGIHYMATGTGTGANAGTANTVVLAGIPATLLDVRVQVGSLATALSADIIQDTDNSLNGFALSMQSNGHLTFSVSYGGALVTAQPLATLVPLSGWYRATLDSSGVATVYTSPDNVTYTQVETTTATPNLGNTASTQAISLGYSPNGNSSPANFPYKRVIVINDGVTKLDVDFTNATVGATTFQAYTGGTVTLTGSAAIH